MLGILNSTTTHYCILAHQNFDSSAESDIDSLLKCYVTNLHNIE